MIKTFNRTPISVNTPDDKNIKNYFLIITIGKVCATTKIFSPLTKKHFPIVKTYMSTRKVYSEVDRH